MTLKNSNLFPCHFSHVLLGFVDILSLPAKGFKAYFLVIKYLQNSINTYSNFKLCCFFERSEQISNHCYFCSDLKMYNTIFTETFWFVISPDHSAPSAGVSSGCRPQLFLRVSLPPRSWVASCTCCSKPSVGADGAGTVSMWERGGGSVAASRQGMGWRVATVGGAGQGCIRWAETGTWAHSSLTAHNSFQDAQIRALGP